MKKKQKLLWLSLISLLLVALTDINVFSSSTAKVYVDPPIAYKDIGESLTVDIKVEDVLYLYSWQVRLDYNTDVLTYVNISEGDFLRDQPEGTYHPPPRIEEEDGWIFFGWSTVGEFLGVSGSGTLAKVEFTVDAVGESALNITHWMTKLFEILGIPVPPGEPNPYREISHERENAVFINSMEPPKADFTFSPSLPVLNELVNFDASASSATAPNVIDELQWDFGDGTTEIYVRDVNFTYTTNHTYTTAGAYTVTLAVIDNTTATELIETIFGTTTMPDIWYELYSTKTAEIDIKFGVNIAVTSVLPSKTQASIGETISISVIVSNKGAETQNFSVTAYYGNNAIETKQVTDLEPEEEETLVFDWDTTGVEEGTYLIWAEATVEGEGSPSDNVKEDGTVEVEAGEPFPTTLVIAGVVVIIIVVAALFLYMRRRGSSS